MSPPPAVIVRAARELRVRTALLDGEICIVLPDGRTSLQAPLLVGYYDASRLVFTGKVGTGFTARGAAELRRTLDAIEIDRCPFDPPPAGWLGRHAHWVKPSLVAEVVFTEWTGEGKIRHPSFQGLRRDKLAASVGRERATGAPPAAPRPSVLGIAITHGDRVMYDRPRITKVDVAEYYGRVADAMLPHVTGRPLTLVRCGSGIASGCLFMKHSKVWAPRELRRVRIQEQTKLGEYLVIESPEAIVALAQMDVLEIHTWNTRYDKVDVPDRVAIDLDPGERVPWPAVVDAARLVRGMLETLDLQSFVKTTGGHGLHVVVPLDRRRPWKDCLAFARGLAAALARHDPALFTTSFGKRGRENRILVDYLRNNRTNTSIAAFSTRARAGAPVSVPIAWDELSHTLDPLSFTVKTVPARLARLTRDPWSEYFTVKQRLSATVLAAVESLNAI